MIYLDNAASTHKKPLSTIISMIKAVTIYSANPSRASHKLSIKTGQKIEECREHIKNFVNAPSDADVIYTYNCTEAINYAIQGYLKKGDHVIISTFEHNAVYRTVANMDISYSIAIPSEEKLTIEDISKFKNENTKMIIINQTSNVTGTTQDINSIGKYCKDNNIVFLVDCAQSGGHEKIDMQKDNISMLALAGHKGLYGPQGIGALVVNNIYLNPIKFGGSGSQSELTTMPDYMPERMEAGTINSVGILGLDGGITYVEKNFDKINNKIKKLSQLLFNYLDNNPKYILYSKNTNSGVISFCVKDRDNQDVVNYLNYKNICIRGGLHCAPLAHKYLGTIKNGVLRVSISSFNKVKDIKTLIKALEKF